MLSSLVKPITNVIRYRYIFDCIDDKIRINTKDPSAFFRTTQYVKFRISNRKIRALCATQLAQPYSGIAFGLELTSSF